MKKVIDDRGRTARLRRRPLEVPDGEGAEASILDECDPPTLGSPRRGRTGAGNEASRDGSAARASNVFMSRPSAAKLSRDASRDRQRLDQLFGSGETAFGIVVED